MQIFLTCLSIILYVAGLCLIVHGYRKYKISLAWILLGLLGPYPYFILYEWKRRRFLSEQGAPIEQRRLAHRRVQASIWFLILAYLVTLFSGVCVYYQVMDGGAYSELKPLMGQIQFYGLLTLSVLYGILIFALHRCGVKYQTTDNL
jgi:hypothetical protein